ncbi:MAG: amino acid decarboxylase [Clostridia bacterium]|nr:amino acid decarboxylase [Clostridia bacterium]
MKREGETPVCDFARRYAERNPLRLHMPGHKGRGGMEALDITEIQGAPPLYPASGILRESEENAARLFGAGRTLYSTEGSSLCIRAMLFLARLRAERLGLPPVILAGRNAHRTFLSAAALLDFQVRWLWGDSWLTCTPPAAEVEAALARMPGPPAAVYLTSPDYLGFRAVVPEIAAVCHARGIPLLVDNAHGAYLRFLPEDQHPLSQGADMTCDSAHKTLPALTGGAYLHLRRDAPPLFYEQAERSLALFASTSPSWLILQSLDRCNARLAGDFPGALAAFLPEARACAARLRERGYDVLMEEPLKMTIRPKAYGYTGDQLHDALRAGNAEGEFSDPDFLVLMLSPEEGAAALARLERVLRAVPRREAIPDRPPAQPRPVAVMPLKQALLSAAETVPLSRCEGRVLADPSVSCPPAVPLLVSGERIDAAALACFRYYGLERVSCVREPLPGRETY